MVKWFYLTEILSYTSALEQIKQIIQKGYKSSLLVRRFK